MCSWNPWWQTMTHGCVTPLLKHKKAGGQEKRLHSPRDINSTSVICSNLWYLSQNTRWFQASGHNNLCQYQLGHDEATRRNRSGCVLRREVLRQDNATSRDCSLVTGNVSTVHPPLWPWPAGESFVAVAAAKLERSPIPQRWGVEMAVGGWLRLK